jgi:hypothetical protein
VTVILTRSWTAANGTSWEAVGFTKVLGASINAVVHANAGQCGASAAERIFLVTGHPQTPGHKVEVDLIWADAVGAGRAPGVGTRWTDDGANGYMAELDSNIDAPRARIRRRRAGAWVDLTGWVDVSALVLSAALEAGVTVTLKCRNEDGQVALALLVAGAEVLTHDDTDDERIEIAGSPALRIDGSSTTSDVIYDNLQVSDLEDEYDGDLGDLAVGVALVVDGVSYSWDDLVEAGIVVGGGRQSYDKGDGWEFTSSALMDAADTILYPGAVVAVVLDGVVVARGRVQAASRKLAPGEGRAYRLVTARQLAADVLLEHPETRANSITWNLPTEHADYDSAYAGKEIGEAIALILDEHADGTTGLRAHLAAPPDEDVAPYVQAELDLLTLKVPAMSASGDPVTAIEQLLAYTKYLLVIDPETLIWHFVDRTAGDIHQVDLDAQHVLGEYTIDPERNCTAGVVMGNKPEPETITLHNGMSGGLEMVSDPAIVAAHSASKAVKNKDVGIVGSVGGIPSAPTMTPDAVGPPAFSMEALEWVKCRIRYLTGAEAGNSYRITTNTNLAFTLVGPYLVANPAPGDEFEVYGDATDGGRDNAFSEVGRRYKLSDSDKALDPDACHHAKITQGNLEKITAVHVVTVEVGQPQEVLLDLPTIGLVNFTSQAHTEPCEEGGAVDEATVEIEAVTFTRTALFVPRLWFPRDGDGNDAYRGTAYTTDPDKWDGGGMPGRGDPGVMRAVQMAAPEFTGAAAEVAEWDAVLEEILSFMATLARSVVVTVHGVLETDCAGLGKRLQILGGPPELETIEDLTLLAIEWNPRANTTTYYAGTLAAGIYDIQKMREASVLVNVRRRTKRDTALLEKLRDCLSGNQHSAGYARQLSHQQICGQQVSTGVTRSGRSATEDFESVLKVLKSIGETIEAQKGGTFEPHDPDSDDPLTYTRDDGQKFYVNPDGTWRSAGDDNVVGNGDDEDVDSPWDTPDDFATDSLEGMLWAALKGILGNLGKTLDKDTFEVVPPGSVAGPGDDWVTYGPGGSETPVPNGGTVPPTHEPPHGPVMENLLKSQEPDGTVPQPGGSMPDGGKFHGPGGALPVPPGGFAPGTALSLSFADFELKGFSVGVVSDPGGLVFSHPDGRVYRVTPDPYISGPKMEQVVAASGGAGTGDNDGDYETPATPYQAAPTERVDVADVEGDGFDPETPDDGHGVYLREALDSSAILGPIALPASEKGYTAGSALLSVVFRGDDDGDGMGNFKVNLYATWQPAGGGPESEISLGSQTITNVVDPRTPIPVTVEVTKPTDATPGRGTNLSVRVEREGTDGADTATDRLCVLAAHVDAPVRAPTLGVKGYA